VGGREGDSVKKSKKKKNEIEERGVYTIASRESQWEATVFSQKEGKGG